jgi:hypothetical protein
MFNLKQILILIINTLILISIIPIQSPYPRHLRPSKSIHHNSKISSSRHLYHLILKCHLIHLCLLIYILITNLQILLSSSSIPHNIFITNWELLCCLYNAIYPKPVHHYSSIWSVCNRFPSRSRILPAWWRHLLKSEKDMQVPLTLNAH